MSENYYTAYDKQGNLIKYNNINDVPLGKQGGAITEQLYREEGLTDFIVKFNQQRKQEAMQEKSDN